MCLQVPRASFCGILSELNLLYSTVWSYERPQHSFFSFTSQPVSWAKLQQHLQHQSMLNIPYSTFGLQHSVSVFTCQPVSQAKLQNQVLQDWQYSERALSLTGRRRKKREALESCTDLVMSNASRTSKSYKPSFKASPAGLATLWKSPVLDRKKKTWEALGSRTNLVMSDASRTSESRPLKDGRPHFFHNDSSHCQEPIGSAGFLRVKRLRQPFPCVFSHFLLCCNDKQQQLIITASQCSSEQDSPSAHESPYATFHLRSSNVGLINTDPFTLRVECSEQQRHGKSLKVDAKHDTHITVTVKATAKCDLCQSDTVCKNDNLSPSL